jgi:hypothetical protein
MLHAAAGKKSKAELEFLIHDDEAEHIQERKKIEKKRRDMEAQDTIMNRPATTRPAGIYQGNITTSPLPHIQTHRVSGPPERSRCSIRTDMAGIPPVPKMCLPKKFR